MLIDIVLIIAGVAMVLYGADRLTEGASALARRMNVPEIIIGLTIVAAGTSAPELFVSLVSALKGTSGMAIGNVVGSNTMNAMLIVGCAAMVAPMTISKKTYLLPSLPQSYYPCWHSTLSSDVSTVSSCWQVLPPSCTILCRRQRVGRQNQQQKSRRLIPG